MRNDIKVRCTICGNEDFHIIKNLVNSRMSSFFKMQFVDRYIYGYVCNKCTHIEWFEEDVLADEEK